MNKNDRLLIGALVLGVWALVAMQFFGGMTASAAAPQRGDSSIFPVYVEIVNDTLKVDDDWPNDFEVEVENWPSELNVYCTNCN